MQINQDHQNWAWVIQGRSTTKGALIICENKKNIDISFEIKGFIEVSQW